GGRTRHESVSDGAVQVDTPAITGPSRRCCANCPGTSVARRSPHIRRPPMLKTSIAITVALTACTSVVGDDDCATGKCDAQDLEVAKDLPEVCSSSELVRITRPVDSDHPDGDTFAFGFRFKPPSDPGAPVLVYLPGGPGQSSIENPASFIPSSW